MKKYLSLLIPILGTIGLVIDVTVFSLDGNFNILRGLGAFRYYTLQSNLIVVVYFTLSRFAKYKNNDLFNRLIGGVTIYITITFFVFAIFLQSGWHPTGWHALANILVHYVVPILTIFYLIMFHKEYTFKKSDYTLWIIYPLLYILFVVVFGSITGDYIYPFFQVSEIGVFGLLFAISLLVIFFLGLSFLLMKIVSKK